MALADLIAALRPAHWCKNLLLAVPLLVGHRFGSGHLDKWERLPAAIAAFCLAASAMYLINDVLDAAADRQHEDKRRRPIAQGRVSSRMAGATAGAMIALAMALALAFSTAWFTAALVAYLLAAGAYSVFLKRLPVLDAIVLAGLYSLRIIAGGLATGVSPSPWLMAFSGFLFLSLALAKRYAELLTLFHGGQPAHADAAGRGYRVGDLDLLGVLGPVMGCLSVLVFCLYINSEDVRKLYRAPQVLWLICPLLLYWVGRLWLLAHRGALHHDPVMFTLTDGVSYLTGLAAVALVWIATVWHHGS